MKRSLTRALATAALGLFGALSAASPASAQCSYELTVIGAMYPLAMNDARTIVGYRIPSGSVSIRACYWTQETGVQLIPLGPSVIESQANHVAENGTIVGSARVTWANSEYRAFVWKDGDLTWIEPPEPIAPSDGTAAYGVSEDGTVFGSTMSPWKGPRPFAWRDGGYIALPEVLFKNEGGLSAGGFGRPNRAGVVAGYTTLEDPSMSGGWRQWAIRYWPDGSLEFLTPLDGEGQKHGGTETLNTNAVLGMGTLPLGGDAPPWAHPHRGVLWTGGGPPIDVGTLPGHNAVLLWGGNDLGQVVGQSYCMYQSGCPAGQPIFWQGGILRNFNDLRPPGTTANATIGMDANNHGVLLARSSSNTWLLTPVGVPDGDVNVDCRVDVADLMMVLEHWALPESERPMRADLDGDGEVGATDLALVLGGWSAK